MTTIFSQGKEVLSLNKCMKTNCCMALVQRHISSSKVSEITIYDRRVCSAINKIFYRGRRLMNYFYYLTMIESDLPMKCHYPFLDSFCCLISKDQLPI